MERIRAGENHPPHEQSIERLEEEAKERIRELLYHDAHEITRWAYSRDPMDVGVDLIYHAGKALHDPLMRQYIIDAANAVLGWQAASRKLSPEAEPGTGRDHSE
jgi:hypothetical protein